MKDQVKEAIYKYFRDLGRQGGLPVQPGNLLSRSVKSNLPHQLKGFYDSAVQDLIDDNFLYYKPAEPASVTLPLGSTAGYAISDSGVARL